MNETTGQKPLVTGLFRDRESAERAYQSVASRGYGNEDTNVIMSDETRNNFYPAGSEHSSALADRTMEDVGKGAAIGGTLGAIVAGIAAIGTSVLLPGLGLIVAGPLAAGLVGAGAGGLTGGLIGALVGHGVPEEHAAEYESGIKEGGVFMGVHPRSEEDAAYFHNEFNTHGSNVHAVGTVGGALAGAAIGSAVPGVGTAVGGVVGGIVGGVAGHETAEAVNPKAGDQNDGDHPVGTGTGAVGGAITGAALGSVVPVVGTAVGGVVGAVGGAVAGHEVAEEVNPEEGDRRT